MSDPFRYAPYWCEENVWHLCQETAALPAAQDRRWALFITNPHKTVAMWGQRAAAGRDPTVWDYHVVLVASVAGRLEVWDLDTIWGAPVAAKRYLEQSFRAVSNEYLPLFRIVPANAYAAHFSSDRSHMRHGDGYRVPPPPWPAIHRPEAGMNLMRFLDVNDPFVGRVTDLFSLVPALWELAGEPAQEEP